MKKIKYSDGTSLSINYQKENNFVSKLKERNGTTIKYSYGKDSANPKGHFWTTVQAKTKSGKSTKNKYEYWVKKKVTGEPYTYKIKTVENGVSTETTYSECCGLPLKIARNGKVTRFKYNDKGMLISKVGPNNSSVKLVYHKTLNKPVKVTDANGTTKFKYDKKGNLTYATNNKGQQIKLTYDRKGKISKMLDSYVSARSKKGKRKVASKKSRTILFKYNEIGKPIRITLKGVGSIKVSYTNSGQIKNVKSDAGHKIALQVTSAFQNLLNIIAPAGVNLSM
jgi:YD repeat-containing protein